MSEKTTGTDEFVKGLWKENPVFIDEIPEEAGSITKRQQIFLKYSFLVLIDLTVLNFFNEYWDLVYIEFFNISLLTAILLQFLLQVTIAVEHRVSGYFKKKTGAGARVLRGLSIWAILFISKLVILWAINIFFGDSVLFSGPVHGLVAFIVVVIGIITTEQVFFKIYKSLG